MGPSGKPTEIPRNETVVFVGGGRGNLPLTALGKAFIANGCKVIFFAGYRKAEEISLSEQMKKSCEKLIYAVEEKTASNLYFQGNVVDALRDYFTKNPQKIDRIFAIGNDKMMHEIAKLRHQKTVKSISDAPIAITSLNAPMQCMMKGVCSQCLQKRKNEKGEEEYFYACASQDQSMDQLNFEHLHHRCQQNSLLEKTASLFIGQ
jgi:NAD(P)H-flavin reductase